MAEVATETFVGANGSVYLAPVGTAAPTDAVTAPPSPWMELGYLDDNGPKVSFDKTVKDILAWQSFDPIRKVPTALPRNVSGNLMQWNVDTVVAVLGGTATPTADGFSWVPPAPQEIDERSLILDALDGTRIVRLYASRVMQGAKTEWNFKAGEAAILPFEYDFLAGTVLMFVHDTALVQGV